MDGEPDLTDINPVHQPGFDHPPTNEPLQSAKCQQDQQAGLQPGCQPAGYPEPGERQGEKQTDKTSQKTVSPFPPKDELEFFKRHMFVDRLKLGRSLVLFELSQPVEVRQRWDSTAQRRPFCDRQTRIRQPRGTANQHHDGEDNRHQNQPDTNRKEGITI